MNAEDLVVENQGIHKELRLANSLETYFICSGSGALSFAQNRVANQISVFEFQFLTNNIKAMYMDKMLYNEQIKYQLYWMKLTSQKNYRKSENCTSQIIVIPGIVIQRNYILKSNTKKGGEINGNSN